MNIFLMGPIGSGKGTQAALLSKNLGIPHISTGDIFRSHLENNTELGKLAKQFMDAGELVPDDVTIDIVKDRLNKEDCLKGFILDGFPRTINQAQKLSEIVKLDFVILFHIDTERIIERLKIRRMCKKCKQPTNTNWLVNGFCEKCGGEVYLREDDKPEAVATRLKKQSIKPEMVEYYKQKNILHEINVSDDVDHTYGLISEVLNKG